MTVPEKLPPDWEPVSPRFKLVFLSVLILTIICLLVAVFLPDESETAKTARDMFKVGCGAIFGLLGGKSL